MRNIDPDSYQLLLYVLSLLVKLKVLPMHKYPAYQARRDWSYKNPVDGRPPYPLR